MAEPTMMPIPSLEKAQVELGKRRLRSTKPAGLPAREDPSTHPSIHSPTRSHASSAERAAMLMGRVAAPLCKGLQGPLPCCGMTAPSAAAVHHQGGGLVWPGRTAHPVLEVQAQSGRQRSRTGTLCDRLLLPSVVTLSEQEVWRGSQRREEDGLVPQLSRDAPGMKPLRKLAMENSVPATQGTSLQ